MRAIHEIATYLAQTGALSTAQLEQLRAAGYVSGSAAPVARPARAAAAFGARPQAPALGADEDGDGEPGAP